MKLANVFFGVQILHGFHGFFGSCFSSIGDIDMQCCFSMGANFLPHIPSIVSVPIGLGALSALLGRPLREPEGPKGFEECLG